MTSETFGRATNLNRFIHWLKDLLDYLNKDNYCNCLYERIGELLLNLYQFSDSEIKNSIKNTLETLLDKAKTEFESL